MYVAEHPLALALDIDVVRGMLGCWLDEPTVSGLIARRMALEVARMQLGEGRDVVVPQFLGRVDFVLALERLCVDTGAEYVEVALVCTPEEAADRFARRSLEPTTSAHRDAELLLPRSGGLGALPGMQEGSARGRRSRPGTITLPTTGRRPEDSYRALLARIGADGA